ncbi:MAG: PqiC family protein [Rhodocyclaceae bacterium]|nr:PqiC family protein [Rhodocyclaceae bacterium]
MRRAVSCALAALLLAGCMLAPVEAPRRHDFADLVITQPIALPIAAITVTMDPYRQQDALAYRLLYASPTHFAHYAGHRWLAPPNKLIERYLERRLAATQGCRLVLHLEEFAQHFTSPTESRWVVLADARLLPPRGKKTLMRRSVAMSLAAEPNAQGAVASARVLVAQLGEEVVAWLMQQKLEDCA